jgi:plasmid stabilization system protein ParE
MGQSRDDLRPSLRSFTHRRYVILFYPGEDGVDVAGVLHSARDIEGLYREGLR